MKLKNECSPFVSRCVEKSCWPLIPAHRCHFPPLTCPPPVSDSSRLLAVLPSLLQDVSEWQHDSSAQGVGEQQVPALEKRLPGKPYADQEVFTRPGKHDFQTAQRTLSSVGEKKKSPDDLCVLNDNSWISQPYRVRDPRSWFNYLWLQKAKRQQSIATKIQPQPFCLKTSNLGFLQAATQMFLSQPNVSSLPPIKHLTSKHNASAIFYARTPATWTNKGQQVCTIYSAAAFILWLH